MKNMPALSLDIRQSGKYSMGCRPTIYNTSDGNTANSLRLFVHESKV